MISELSWATCTQLLHDHKGVWANLGKETEILVRKTCRDARENPDFVSPASLADWHRGILHPDDQQLQEKVTNSQNYPVL